ncbi:hypothetical protein NEIG_01966 [Nematocida sp. ERTm5]|nr:hypothetical protein NEIG_01966 [Nematocida sp. ERTm5]
MENDQSYSLTKKIVDGLENDLESLFSLLKKCVKEKLSIPSEILVNIIESKKALTPSKALCMRLLRDNLESEEEKRSISYLISSIRFMFRVSEMIKIDAEAASDSDDRKMPEHTLEILESLARIMESIPLERKGAVVDAMERCGIFILINLWCSPSLLKFYSSIFSKIESESSISEKVGKKEKRKTDSTPYRIAVEESIYNKTTILVHRRDPAYFMPKYFCAFPESTTDAYRRVFSFQDEYEIFHKSLVNWCENQSDLKGIESATIWHLNNLVNNIEVPTYEKEILFCLTAMFYSAIQNTVDEAEAQLFKSYLELVRASKQCGSAEIRGTSLVAAQRLSSYTAKYFLSRALTITKETKDKKKADLWRERVLAIDGLAVLCDILSESDLLGVKKIVEKDSSRILEMLEIQPRDNVNKHCTSVIRVLSILDSIPICLLSPSKLSLVMWVVENVNIPDRQVRRWTMQYIQELPSVYNPNEENFLGRALYF